MLTTERYKLSRFDTTNALFFSVRLERAVTSALTYMTAVYFFVYRKLSRVLRGLVAPRAAVDVIMS